MFTLIAYFLVLSFRPNFSFRRDLAYAKAAVIQKICRGKVHKGYFSISWVPFKIEIWLAVKSFGDLIIVLVDFFCVPVM